MDSASSIVGGLLIFFHNEKQYQYTIAEITENFIALLRLEDPTFRDIVFLEEHPADSLSPLWFDFESTSVHFNLNLIYNLRIWCYFRKSVILAHIVIGFSEARREIQGIERV